MADSGTWKPEGLVIDDKSDNFGIGYIQHGLAGAGKTISFLAVDDRPRFVESIHERAVLQVRSAFFRSSTHADIAVS
jgi:hypothetical protein